MKVLGGVLAGVAVLLLCTGFGATTVFRSPVQLVTDGPEQLTTNSGQSFTTTFYSGFDQDSYYFVHVSTYPFTVMPEDLQRAMDGYATSFGGKITDTQNLTVSGQPALQATVVSPDTRRFQYVATYKNNRLFQFAVSGTPFDSPEVSAFFESVRIN